MADLMFLEEMVRDLKEQGLYNTIRTIGSPQGAWIEVDGKKCLNFCSNNYLGLANDPRLREAATEAIERFGVGPGAVRTIAGTNSLHELLETKLAEFKGVDATLSLQSGWCANEAVIPAITGPEDAIFSDALNHASIIDGCRLSKAKRHRYAHCDAEDLAKQLESNKDDFRRALVVTDGVFSMDGDVAPLDELSEITGRYDNVLLMVDDAHGEGVLGRGGRGAADHFGLHEGQVDIEIGTMSKAFGVVGGYVAGRKPLIEYLRQRARPLLFSSAVTPPDVAACIRSVEILSESTELVDKLWDNGRAFQESMQEAGFDTGKTQTPITPVMIGDEKTTQEMSRRLFEEKDIFASAIAYPTVPKGQARIRVMVSAAHSLEDLEAGVRAFTEIGRDLGVV